MTTDSTTTAAEPCDTFRPATCTPLSLPFEAQLPALTFRWLETCADDHDAAVLTLLWCGAIPIETLEALTIEGARRMWQAQCYDALVDGKPVILPMNSREGNALRQLVRCRAMSCRFLDQPLAEDALLLVASIDTIVTRCSAQAGLPETPTIDQLRIGFIARMLSCQADTNAVKLWAAVYAGTHNINWEKDHEHALVAAS